MRKVFLANQIPDDLLDSLRDVAEITSWSGPEPVERSFLLEAIVDCDGLLSMLNTPIDIGVLELAPRLKVISQMAVGVDNIPVEPCLERGIKVGHTPGVLTETVADLAFSIIGSVVRRLPEGERMVQAGEWGPWEPWSMLGGDIHGATLGIVGMGRIGQAIAKRASGFSMRVVYDSPRKMGIPGAERLTLSELLRLADIVVLTVPLNAETTGLISKDELDLMKSNAFLINVARGPVVDTDALVHALEIGSIAGAGLDVTHPEPLPADHPLVRLDNCLVVPHLGSSSWSTRRAMARLAVENLVAGVTGSPMPAEYQA